MTVRALSLVRPAPRHDPFESRPLKPISPVADLNRSSDEAGTQGLSRAATPGPGFWLRGVDYHSSSARLGSLLAIHRGNRPLQRPRLFIRQPPLSELSFTHISLLTEVLTVINLAVIFHNTAHLVELSNEPSDNTIAI